MGNEDLDRTTFAGIINVSQSQTTTHFFFLFLIDASADQVCWIAAAATTAAASIDAVDRRCAFSWTKCLPGDWCLVLTTIRSASNEFSHLTKRRRKKNWSLCERVLTLWLPFQLVRRSAIIIIIMIIEWTVDLWVTQLSIVGYSVPYQ